MAPEADTTLERELAEVAQRAPRISAEATFRATVEARLRSLEEQLSEVKTRLNGLLFFIAGTVLAQVVLRLVE
jgi:hypothetical protein